jgi:hypothetical protein
VTKGEPGQAGYRVGAAQQPLGRAQRYDAGEGLSLYRLPEHDAGTAGRLLALGSDGVGGFADGGRDSAGIWLIRRAARAPLSAWLRARRSALPWQEAVSVTQAFAQAAAASESAELFPGKFSTETLFVDSEPGALLPIIQVPADGMVAALLGAPDEHDERGSDESLSRRWIAPAQAEGAPWDHAANSASPGYGCGARARRARATCKRAGGCAPSLHRSCACTSRWARARWSRSPLTAG